MRQNLESPDEGVSVEVCEGSDWPRACLCGIVLIIIGIGGLSPLWAEHHLSRWSWLKKKAR